MAEAWCACCGVCVWSESVAVVDRRTGELVSVRLCPRCLAASTDRKWRLRWTPVVEAAHADDSRPQTTTTTNE
jgi:hypothetical protein